MSFDVTFGFPLTDAKSMNDLVARELHRKQYEAQVLSRAEQSEARTLRSLHVYVTHIADQVEKLGFPVPNSIRSLDTVNDLKTLLQKHVFEVKQEIESMRIEAQMRSVASEVSRDSGSREDLFKCTSDLTQEFLALQLQTAHLMAKKVDIVDRLVAVTAGSSHAGSIIQQPAFTESKNLPFVLSKGALTVWELGTSSASATPLKISDPALAQFNNRATGGWGNFLGATKSHDSPSPQSFGVKIDTPPTLRDSFGFGPLLAAPIAAEATTQNVTLASAPENDFVAWSFFSQSFILIN